MKIINEANEALSNIINGEHPDVTQVTSKRECRLRRFILKLNKSFLTMFLDTPPWSSDRDPQRRFPRLQTFRPFESPDVFGGGPHPVISRMSLSVFLYPSEPNAYRRLWEALFGLLMPVTVAWTGATSESSQWLLHVAYYLLLTCNLRLCEALFGPFMSIASTPAAYSGHGSSQWLFHTVYLIYANWAL